MAETYHGIGIPEDIWGSWADPNSSEAYAWRRGVVDAAHPLLPADQTERERLDALAEARDAADQAAFEEKNKDEPWMKRRLAFREMMKEK